MDKDFLSDDEAIGLLDKITFMSLTTCSLKAEPWCSPVFFAYDKDLNFYWLSSPEARHSRNIHENAASSIVVYDSTAPDGEGWGIYFEGKAEIIQDENPATVKLAHETSMRRAGGSVEETSRFLGDAARKYYIFKPEKAWSNGIVRKVGFTVDIRREIDLGTITDHLGQR